MLRIFKKNERVNALHYIGITGQVHKSFIVENIFPLFLFFVSSCSAPTSYEFIVVCQHGYELPPYFYPPTPLGAHVTLVTKEEANSVKVKDTFEASLQHHIGR